MSIEKEVILVSSTEWGEKQDPKICSRRVRALCAQGRIVGARKVGANWVVPEDAPVPEHRSRGRNPIEK